METAFEIATALSRRSTCDRRAIGAVVMTKSGRILSTGYNGAPPGAPHCDDVGHLLIKGRCMRTVHAEANAVAHAARHGTSLDNGVLACLVRPCPACTNLLISCGVREFNYVSAYHDTEDSAADELCIAGGVKVFRWSTHDGIWTRFPLELNGKPM